MTQPTKRKLIAGLLLLLPLLCGGGVTGSYLSVVAKKKAAGGVLVSDTFTDTESTAITSHSPDTNTPGGSYQTYATYGPFETPIIKSNKVQSLVDAIVNGVVVIETNTGNVQLSATLNRDAVNPAYGGQGLAFRWDVASGNGYYFDRTSTDGFRLNKVTSGTSSVLVDEAGTFSETGDWEWSVVLSGDSIKCYYDSTLVIDTTDSSYNSNTEHGISFVSQAINIGVIADELSISSN